MTDQQKVHVSGYAVTHGTHQVYGGPDAGGWIETITREALERAVQDRPHIPLRVGDQIVGEADLTVDDTGLRIDADVDLIFAFRVLEDQWTDNYNKRHIAHLELNDFSIGEGGGSEPQG